VLPHGEDPWDYGETLFAGSDMKERREILGRLSPVYLVIEGGPGTRHEVQVATARNAAIIPVGRSGGYAAEWYARMARPAYIDEATWAILDCRQSTPDDTAKAVLAAVTAFFEQNERTRF
jgi:predicted Rossmann-fold nucleotide-binding protein